jgi:hypothetical protein
MKIRLIALSVIAGGAIALAHPVHANVNPPPTMKVCAVDLTGDGTADSWCIGRNGCYIGPNGCYAW